MDPKVELNRHLVWLEGALEKAEPQAVAGLLRERRITLHELASAGGALGSVRNDLAAARDKRRAAAAASQATA